MDETVTDLGPGGRAGPGPRRWLVAVDALAVGLGSAVGASHVDSDLHAQVAVGVVVAATGIASLAALGLYRRRTCTAWGRETARIVAAVVLMAAALAVVDGPAGGSVATAGLRDAAVLWLLGLVVVRGLFREWMLAARAGGEHGAPSLVVGGTTAAAGDLTAFLTANDVLGHEVRGVATVDPLVVPSSTRDVLARAREVAATSVVLDGRSLTGEQVTTLTTSLSDAGLHVHVTTGLMGVDHRRVTTTPLADEVVLHVAPSKRRPPVPIAKTVLDVSLAGAALLLTAPVLALAALAIRLEDGGPVLFRQERIGRDGVPFSILKLRTMSVDAERHRSRLQADNQRTGPLFKLDHDPRVTRIGRLLRASSIDELPQLWNVVRRTMSLVGPRPALPSEVAAFDVELLERLDVLPGITGLWQVEARDVSSFDLYRRYDLMYVRNWSLAGDLQLIARTVAAITVRAVRSVVTTGTGHRRRIRRGRAAP